jgi:hypothetical protein
LEGWRKVNAVKFWVWISALVVLVSCTHSGPTLSEGPGTETENLSGFVQNPDGSAAVGIRVRIRTSDYLAGASADGSSLFGQGQANANKANAKTTKDRLTDSAGRFQLDSMPSGKYFFAADDREALAVGMPISVDGREADRNLDPVVLLSTGFIKGAIALPGPGSGGLRVRIFGLEKSVQADPVTGVFLLDHIPQGTYRLWVSDTLGGKEGWEFEGVSTRSGEIPVSVNTVYSPPDREDYSMWAHSRNLRLNTSPTGVDLKETLTGFPLLVRLNASNFDFAQSGRSAIRFSDVGGAKQPYQVERWDSANALAEIWIRLDTLRAQDSGQILRMYWGNPQALDRSTGKTVFDTASGFAGVWHLQEGAIGKSHLGAYGDATALGNDGDDEVGSRLNEGMVGLGQHLDSGDFIPVIRMDPQLKDVSLFTLSAWIKLDSGVSRRENIMKLSTTFGLQVTDKGFLQAEISDGKSFLISGTGTVAVRDGKWHRISARYDGKSLQVYRDGIFDHGRELSAEVFHPQYSVFLIGISSYPVGEYFYQGYLDEIRVSDIPYSPEWLRMDFENQRSGTGFPVFGSP